MVPNRLRCCTRLLVFARGQRLENERHATKHRDEVHVPVGADEFGLGQIARLHILIHIDARNPSQRQVAIRNALVRRLPLAQNELAATISLEGFKEQELRLIAIA